MDARSALQGPQGPVRPIERRSRQDSATDRHRSSAIRGLPCSATTCHRTGVRVRALGGGPRLSAHRYVDAEAPDAARTPSAADQDEERSLQGDWSGVRTRVVWITRMETYGASSGAIAPGLPGEPSEAPRDL